MKTASTPTPVGCKPTPGKPKAAKPPAALPANWREQIVQSPANVAAILGTHTGTVRAAIAAGQMPHVRVGRLYFVPTAWLLKIAAGAKPLV